MAEVAFHFQHESADALVLSLGLVREQLLDEGIHAATVLPVPMAPTMAMPVYRPRSGMTSQLGSLTVWAFAGCGPRRRQGRDRGGGVGPGKGEAEKASGDGLDAG